jgi:hypothetical protein
MSLELALLAIVLLIAVVIFAVKTAIRLARAAIAWLKDGGGSGPPGPWMAA